MMLYTLIADSNKFLGAAIDSTSVEEMVGSLRGERRNDRIDVNHVPRSWSGVFTEPVLVNFTQIEKGGEKTIPDIGEFQGRLFLNKKAYKVLEPLIKEDGDFIAAKTSDGDGYIFTPLRVADVDKKVTVKNEWDEIVSLGFEEEQVKDWMLFRTEYNGYMRLYCGDTIKNAIENANLTGCYITSDLANIFPEERGNVADLNG